MTVLFLSVPVPAKDKHHDAVVNALRKAGWTTIDEQVMIILEERRLWIDLQIARPDQDGAILIEIKGFENMPSPVEYLAQAIGKYRLYLSVLNYLKIDHPLYMAVPEAAYRGILSEAIGQQTLQQNAVKLLVFDPEAEEIIEWID
ncbi:MAG: fatty-acid synthase [Chloroflexaceae bacterium]|nr:fatty-acid synthase [bacterium]NJO07797.1 fatty-acid synthase [Chloroflexaceae bacterium]